MKELTVIRCVAGNDDLHLSMIGTKNLVVQADHKPRGNIHKYALDRAYNDKWRILHIVPCADYLDIELSYLYALGNRNPAEYIKKQFFATIQDFEEKGLFRLFK